MPALKFLWTFTRVNFSAMVTIDTYGWGGQNYWGGFVKILVNMRIPPAPTTRGNPGRLTFCNE